MGYFKDTVKGVSWMGGLRVVTRVVAFLKIAILARLLSPAQFGVYGIAALVLAFLEIITETGINVFFIQEEGEIKKFVNTAWIVSIARGVLISLVIIALSPLISSFFKSPDSYRVLLFMSLVPLIKGFINPAEVKFQKELEFNKEFLLRLAIFCVDAATAISVAFVTRSAASLVWGLMAGGVAEVLLSFIFIKPRPSFVFEAPKIKRVIARGKWVTAYGVFDYLFENVDDITVGRLLDTTSLGIYQTAYKISSLPISEVADVFGKVTFPVFVKISGDMYRLKKAFFKALLSVAGLTLPLGCIFYFFPKEIVLIILGSNWLAAAPVLKTLSLFGVIRGLTGPTSALFLALRKQEFVTMVTLVGFITLGVSIIPLVLRFGVMGAAYSALAGAVAVWPLVIYYLVKIFRSV